MVVSERPLKRKPVFMAVGDSSQTSLVSAALVREWLKRHELSNSLAALEVEFPRGEDAISSRTELGKILGIEKQLRRNKEKEKASDPGALKSTLEVLSDYVIRSAQAKSEKHSAGGEKHSAGGEKHSAGGEKHSAGGENAPSAHANIKPSSSSAPSKSADKAKHAEAHPKPLQSHNEDPCPAFPPSPSSFAQPMFEKARRRAPPAAVVDMEDAVDGMACCDVEDFDDEFDVELRGVGGRPAQSLQRGALPSRGSWIGIQQAADLKALVFGAGGRSSFNDAWMQGFFRSSHAGLEWGVVQTAGGPCGVLASVQAYLLRHLLFVENRMDVAGISQATFDQAVIHALTDILWQAGGEQGAKLAVKGSHTMSGDDQDTMSANQYKPDGLTEKLTVLSLHSRASLYDAVDSHSGAFLDPKGPGVPLLLYSAVLSRGIHNVKSDIGAFEGQEPRLMGAHDYCTQEMVNLLLVGRAVPNAFDGNKDLDGFILNGVHKRSNVGLLTLFEHYGSMEVGGMLKSPVSPVWVVCSESHFSIAFATDADAVESATAKGGTFDLHYYDELAKQDEPIRLSISYDISRAGEPKVILDHGRDTTPPLEHCIRTRWAHAHVNWNGTDPIL